MTRLGNRAWELPGWLGARLPAIDIEGQPVGIESAPRTDKRDLEEVLN
jgi:hypothetical protein